MQRATDIALPVLDVLAPAFSLDPSRFVIEARREHPWLAKTSLGLIILDYQGSKDLLGLDEKFRTPNRWVTELMGAEGTPWGRWNNEFMLAQDGEKHARLRDLVAATFSPRNANLQRGLMRATASALLDEWAPRGEFDFAEFASFYPISVMCRLVGAPVTVVPEIKDALEVMGSGFNLDPSLVPSLNVAFAHLWNFVDRLIAERRQSGPVAGENVDLLDLLLEANESGDHLTDEELYDLLILLFGAGYDTSKNLLTMIAYQMLGNMEGWAQMAQDGAYTKKVIEETLRLSSVVSTFRLANVDIVYRDLIIPKDTVVIFPLPLAGRDPDVFSDPMTFNTERKPEQKHMAFGRGAHICLGQFLARAQIEEGLPLMAQRITNPRLNGEPEWRPFMSIWGLKRLPIIFDPAPSTMVN